MLALHGFGQSGLFFRQKTVNTLIFQCLFSFVFISFSHIFLFFHIFFIFTYFQVYVYSSSVWHLISLQKGGFLGILRTQPMDITHTYIYLYIHVYIHTYMYLYTYEYVCKYKSIYSYIYICIYTHPYIFTYVHMNLYIYIYRYTYIYLLIEYISKYMYTPSECHWDYFSNIEKR